jgi:hypothetical protein
MIAVKAKPELCSESEQGKNSGKQKALAQAVGVSSWGYATTQSI